MDNIESLSLIALKEAGGLYFFYPGHPLARRSGIHQTHNDRDAKLFKTRLGWAAVSAAKSHGVEWYNSHIPMEGPIVLGITVFRMGPPTNKPDLDNYLKLVADALQQARIYIDDAHVVEYFPGTSKRDSKVEGIRVIVVPQGRMAALGFGESE